MRSVSQLREISPFIVTPQEFDSISANNIGDAMACMAWLHLTRKGLIESEHELLSYDVQRCCTYDEEKQTYDMDLYWCSISESDEEPVVPNWWTVLKSAISASSYGVKMICVNVDDMTSGASSDSSSSSSSSSSLDSIYKGRYTNEVEKLDFTITLDWTKIAKMKKCAPVPILGTVSSFAFRMTEDADIGMEKYVEAYLSDLTVAYHTFGPVQDEPCLQDIIFHGCPTHDQVIQQDFSYSYKVNGITIECEVKKDGDSCTLHFTSDVPEDLRCYIGWNDSICEEFLSSIESISDASTYRRKETYDND